MGWPEKQAVIPTLGQGGKLQVGKIHAVELLGHKERLQFTQDENALTVQLPASKPSDHAITLKIAGA